MFRERYCIWYVYNVPLLLVSQYFTDINLFCSQLVVAYVPKEIDKFPALEKFNVPKNRCEDLIPMTTKRVPLPNKPGIQGSDYINASFLQVGSDFIEQSLIQLEKVILMSSNTHPFFHFTLANFPCLSYQNFFS